MCCHRVRTSTTRSERVVTMIQSTKEHHIRYRVHTDLFCVLHNMVMCPELILKILPPEITSWSVSCGGCTDFLATLAEAALQSQPFEPNSCRLLSSSLLLPTSPAPLHPFTTQVSLSQALLRPLPQCSCWPMFARCIVCMKKKKK